MHKKNFHTEKEKKHVHSFMPQRCILRKKRRTVKEKHCAKRKSKLIVFFPHLIFYLHSVILGSGFPQHGVAGVLKSGRGAAAEGVNVTLWMEERSRGWRCGKEWVSLRDDARVCTDECWGGREGGGWEVTRVADVVAKKFGPGGERLLWRARGSEMMIKKTGAPSYFVRNVKKK